MDKNPNDEHLSEWVHMILGPLRNRAVQVSASFGHRVADGIEQYLARPDEQPSIARALLSVILESTNLVTRALQSERGAEDGDHPND